MRLDHDILIFSATIVQELNHEITKIGKHEIGSTIITDLGENLGQTAHFHSQNDADRRWQGISIAWGIIAKVKTRPSSGTHLGGVDEHVPNEDPQSHGAEVVVMVIARSRCG